MSSGTYLKGVLDAKIAKLLNESDFSSFASLKDEEQLNFFINNELVSTSIVTNFEALCKHALSDLKDEVALYTNEDSLYVNYFFATSVIKKEKGALRDLYNLTYQKALTLADDSFVNYLDYAHALLNVLTLVRGKKRGDNSEALLANYLEQSLIGKDAFTSLVTSDIPAIYNYLKVAFNIDVSEKDTPIELEAKIDKFLFHKLKDFATESEFIPTLIYYVRMKQLQIERLRNIRYTKRNVDNG
ncbi:MAG: hypothetical protein BWX57_00504 [Tenericutes bacterium ADurb.Bin024]|nr:MAG: hypothetical protein BWX57_00504 [Tenericutes bacterium ADurb.Bin024]